MNKLILQLLFVTLFGAFNVANAQKTWYSSPDGDGNGMNPGNTGELQAMIDNANNGDTILLTSGKYVPYNVIKGGTWHDQDNNSAFLIRKNVTIIGGYDRAFKTKGASTETILSGENKRFHVVVIAENSGTKEAVAPTIENLTIQKGGNNSVLFDLDVNIGSGLNILTVEKRRGAGMFIIKAKPAIKDVIIKDNVARTYGGGVYIEDSAPVFVNVTISHNTAQGAAAGLDIVKSFGGAVYNKNSNSVFLNTLINDNVATDGGGGVYVDFSLIKKVTPTFINTTIVNNSAPKGFGGGICVFPAASTLEVKNSIIANNRANTFIVADKSAQIHHVTADSFYNSYVQGESFNKIQNNLNGSINPKLNPITFELEPGSPLIDMGNNLFNPYYFDLAGNKRLSGVAIDLGAKEYQYKYQITEKLNQAITYLCDEVHTVGYGDSHIVKFSVNEGFRKYKDSVELYINDKLVLPTRIDSITYQINITNITEDKFVEIKGVKLDTEFIDGIEVVEADNSKVYTSGNTLYVKVNKDSQLSIYTITGKLYTKREVSEGVTTIEMPKGIYIVQVDKKSHKVLIGK